jgi:hypothetical protein
MKQRKTPKFIAVLFSMAFMLTLAFAFTAKADAADVAFKKVDKFTSGKNYVIATNDNGTWKAMTASATSPSSSGTLVDILGTNVTVDDVIVLNPADNLVWAVSSDAAGYQVQSNNGGALYLCSQAPGTKYQSQGYRPILDDDPEYLYVFTGTDSQAGTKDTYMYLTFDGTQFGTSSASRNTDQATARQAGAKFALFEELTADEYETYQREKAAAELKEEKDAAKAEINNTDCDQKLKDDAIAKVDAATDKAAIDQAVADFKEAVKEAAEKEEAQKALEKAVKDAQDKINASKCDQKIKDKYLDQLNSAKSESAVADILKNFEDEVKKSGGEVAPTPADPETAKEEQKKATDEINKVAADTSKYDADEQKAIKDLANQYIIKINSTTNVNEIKNLVNAFNAEIKALPTKADKAAIAKIQIKLKKIKVGKKKMTVKWTPKKANFDGYELSYVPKPKKKAKKIIIKKGSASKKVIKKLKKGKKYKVKVRGYKLFGTKKDIKVYGKWSKTKTSKKIK